MRHLAFVIALLCVGCTAPTAQPTDVTAAYEKALAASRAQPSTKQNGRYVTAAFADQKKLITRSSCYKDSDSYHIILRVDANGSVGEVLGREENGITRCFRESFNEARFPAPPFSPFYLEFCRRDGCV